MSVTSSYLHDLNEQTLVSANNELGTIKADASNGKRNSLLSTLANATLVGAIKEEIPRVGSAIKEYIVAYSGIDNEAGKHLTRSLKGTHGEYLKAHNDGPGGITAEILKVAHENEKKILNGESTRVIRTDDMKRQPDGRGGWIGGVNEPRYDHAEVDANGRYIRGTGTQMKYVGNNAKRCLEYLKTPKFDEKYYKQGIPVEIPKEFYDDVKSALAKEIKILEKKRASLLKTHPKQIKSIQEQLDHFKRIDRLTRKGTLTKSEAIEALHHPLKAAIKDTGRIAHNEGIHGAEFGAAIRGGMSLITNINDVLQGRKTSQEAILDTATEAGKGAVSGYLVASSTSIISGALRNSTSQLARKLGSSTLIAPIVVGVTEAGATVADYLSGKLTSSECLTIIGEKCACLAVGNIGALAGQTLIPVPVVGGLVGSMIGGAVASAMYRPMAAKLQDMTLSPLSPLSLSSEELANLKRDCGDLLGKVHSFRTDFEKGVAACPALQDESFLASARELFRIS